MVDRTTGAAASDPLVTPEAVPLDFPLATVGSRAIALLLDLTIQAASFVALVVAATAAASATGVSPPGWLAITAVLLLSLVVQLGYPIGFETLWRGRTPGKAALGLRVLTTEGGPVGLRHAALRAALGLVDFALTSGTAALTSALVTRRHQRLGDLAAGTVVVRERTASEPLDAVTFTAPAGLSAYSSALDVSAVDAATYQTVRALLRRAPTLAPEVRDRLARDVATRVVERVRPAPPEGTGPLDYLAAVAAAVQARHRRSGQAAPLPQPAPPMPRPAAGTPHEDAPGGGGGFAPPA